MSNNSNTVKLNTTPRNNVAWLIFAIILLVIIIYVLRIIYNDYSTYNNSEPWLVRGTKMGKTLKIVRGNKIHKSTDQQFGIEFTYSFWIYINDWTYKQGAWKHILHKGSKIGMPLQAPGFWLYPYENKMAINMNTYYSVKESCDIGNIPIGKWVHITASVMGKNMDVYINGELKKRCTFKGIPKQNYGDIYINDFQGFDGFLSQVRYFDYALPIYKIEQIIREGPSKAPCVDTGEKPPYLADNYWLTTGYPNTVY